MIRKDNERISGRKPAPFGGTGEVTITCLLNNPEEMEGKGRAFNHITVYPGSEIGYHVHHGDAETYYILSGEGTYTDDGETYPVRPGDITFCPEGHSHGLACAGSEPLIFMALIINT